MKIVIAPTAFKGSLTPLQAARAIELGVRSAMPEAETVLVPVADGGDGTVEAIHHAKGGAILEQT
ncbi:MAG: glycerate kinase, partial [Dehalococcoidia bacterium]|nr:glycerate kinase [Dehalococcoidia bacterium]